MEKILDETRYSLGEGGGRIVREIDMHIQENGGSLPGWYVGITNDPKRRRSEHERDNDRTWKDWDAGSKEVAEEVENSFHEDGCQGKNNNSGGNEDSHFVYAFRVN